MVHAACRGMDHSVFYPEPTARGIGIQAARVCFSCPVQDQCLEWALDHERFGTWGGTSEQDRAAMRKGILRRRCPVCGGARNATTALGQTCMACGVSWVIRQPRENADAPAR